MTISNTQQDVIINCSKDENVNNSVQDLPTNPPKDDEPISSRRQLILTRRRIGQNIHNIRKRKNLTLKKLSKIAVIGENLRLFDSLR
jgi:hypothetical protein